jgi:hypothetical protein
MSVTAQVDRLKMEEFQGQLMRDQIKLRSFEQADEAAVLGYWLTAGFLRRVVWSDFLNEAGVGFGSF